MMMCHEKHFILKVPSTGRMFATLACKKTTGGTYLVDVWLGNLTNDKRNDLLLGGYDRRILRHMYVWKIESYANA